MYPSFQHVDKAAFKSWHATYTQRMGYIAAPLMIAQLALAILQTYKHPQPLSFTYLALVALTWLATFAFSVPLHQKLQTNGPHPQSISKLVSTNWIRTALWSLIALRHLPFA
ncbi:hypothetical protein VDG1235_3997 [Verrucomicrobiia bacterium DG1235]|nr:hypothetical protein VDG1235_3997 [Verrucomicrobiae bacterium DG1235]